MSGNPLLEGPLVRSVLRVGAPAALFQILIFANNFIDYQWVQRLGPEAAAGQTAGWTILWTILSLAQIFSIGITAIVARRVGEAAPAAAADAARHGLSGALLASLLVGGGGWFLVPLLIRGNAASPAAAAHTLDYLRTACAGAPLIFLFYAGEGIFKGRGDMRRPLYAVAGAVALNLVLDPLLIHVAGLEVLGAALATVVAFGVTGAILVALAFRRGWTARGARGLDLGLVGRVIRIGTPVSLHGIVFSFVYIFIVAETNRAGGDAATAALGFGLRFEGFAYMVSVGFCSAAAALVGQNLGAGNLRRANDAAWTAVRVAVWISGAWGLLLLLLPAPAVGWMSPGAATAAYAVDYFEIVAMSLAFTAVEIVLEGAFSGAGDTLPPMLLGLPLTIVRIPLAMLLSRGVGWGVAGVFWALTITSVLRGLAFAFWFSRGRWVRAVA